MRTEQIKDNTIEQKEKIPLLRTLTSIAALIALANLSTSLPLKSNNQRFIVLVCNPIFYAQIKYIDIWYHYICDEIVIEKINLQYIPTSEMIVDRLIKALI